MPSRIISDIAKRLGIDLSELLDRARDMGMVDAKAPSSELDPVAAEKLEKTTREMLMERVGRGLRCLQLGNFKAFADVQSVPIRPLTLVFGANSSGKSSIIHGLLLARHAQDSGELDVSRTEIGGDSVDLGGFRQYLHRREMSRRVEWSAEINVNLLNRWARDLLGEEKTVKVSATFGVPLDDQGQPLPNEAPWLLSYAVEGGESGRVIVRLSRRPDGTLHVDRIAPETLQPLMQAVLLSNTTAQRIDPLTDLPAAQEAVEQVIPMIQFSTRGLLPDRMLGEDVSASLQAPQLVPIQRAERTTQLAGSARLFVPHAIGDLIRRVNNALRDQLARVRYLGPLRSFPPRHLAFSDEHGRNWMAGGGYAWDLVRTNWAVRRWINKWLGSDFLQTRYELQIRTLGALDAMEQPLADAIEGLPIEEIYPGEQPGVDSQGHEYDGDPPGYGVKNPSAEAQKMLKTLREQVGEKYDELVLLDLRSNTPVTHRDVGIGISQVLPVLVHTYANEGKLIAIEQPEIHLHPALQAELGDLFIDSALGPQKNTFLLETHSEHLILRIMRRIRETHKGTLPKGATPVTSKDVSILFVEPDGARSIVREMPLNDLGELVKAWPGGFFEEGLRELLP